MLRDVLPSLQICQATDISQKCVFLTEKDWLIRCYRFGYESVSHHTIQTSTSGCTATPFLMCCLHGAFTIHGQRGGRVESHRLRAGEAAYWESGCWLGVDGDSADSQRLRLNIAPTYRLLAFRDRRRNAQGPLLARLQPGARSGLQEHLLAQVLVSDEVQALNLLRCLLADVARECLRPLLAKDRAQATFQAICHYLHEHAEQAPGRVEIAKALGLHAGHVSRLITRFAGCSLSELRHRGQLERAQRLLRDSDADIAGIARAAGFSSSTHFIRVFKAAFACTPGQWQRRSRKR